MPPCPTPRAQRGLSLIDALLACCVLAFGAVALLRLQAQLHDGAGLAQQQAEALRLAQAEVEALRGYSVLETADGRRAWADLVDARRVHEADSARYTIDRRVADLPGARAVSVTAHWIDRRGQARQLRLDTVVARADPALSGVPGLVAPPPSSLAPRGRSLHVPYEAKDLGDGRSAFKPVADGPLVIVQDGRSGSVLARCTLADTRLRTRDLRPGLLTDCDTTPGLLLSGQLRFSAASPVDPAVARDLPLALAMAVVPDAGGAAPAPVCAVEARRTVAWVDAAGRHVAAVAAGAVPAEVGATTWTELPERHTAYHCVVHPSGGAWAGRSLVVPNGWSIGTGAADRRVCRHSADLDASGAVDRPLEHPARYTAVSSALAHQNFLVVAGSENCPGAPAVNVRGAAGDVFADLGTASHQP